MSAQSGLTYTENFSDIANWVFNTSQQMELLQQVLARKLGKELMQPPPLLQYQMQQE